jgi:7-keto-8-aminopelargonate synthetase-like enzyme
MQSAGIILGNDTIKAALINFARPSIYSASPSFPFVAAIRAGHKLLGTPEAREVSNIHQAQNPHLTNITCRVKIGFNSLPEHFSSF